jgi:hypothetical protein
VARALPDQITGYTGYQTPEEAQARAATLGQTGEPYNALYQYRYGIPTESGTEQGYILRGYRDAQGNLIKFRDEEGNLIPLDEAAKRNVERQKAEDKKRLIERRVRPMFISDYERNYLRISKEDMQSMGYAWDEESQQWILGEGTAESPQVYGAGAPRGYAGGYYPRSYGGGGGGGGYPVGGYGDPMAGGGIEINFPEGRQSFVQRGQRGVSPQQRRNQAARFGAVSWRI